MSNTNKRSSNMGFTPQEKMVRPLNGVYIGEVISSRDASFTGRIRVFVPELGKDRRNTAGHFDCLWSSPFAGATNQRSVGENIPQPEDSMQSYGMWMIPPDPGNLVVVAFADGDSRKGVIISTLFPDRFNWSVPGYPASRTYASAEVPLPSTEKNKRVDEINHDDTTRPIHYEIAESITRQGLIRDARRGPGSSGARRESPSEVFGFLTPGPRESESSNYRVGGHQLIFDDNLDNRMVRIRTAAGQQLLFDDNAGTIYAINKDGESWWEMDAAGNFTVFGEGSINLRAKQDFNLRADKDINIEAGGDVKIKAAGDFASRERGSEYVGPNTMGDAPAGYGGSITLEAARNLISNASLDQYMNATSGSVHVRAETDLHLTAAGTLHGLAEQGIHFSSNQGISLGAGSEIVVEAADNAVIKGAQVLLNSGGPGATNATASEVPEELETVDSEDQPIEKPEFERNAEDALPSAGRRPGETTTVSSIVPVLVTAEPYAGHNQYDPTAEDIGSIDQDESIADGLPDGSNGVTNSAGEIIRNDVVTPNGTAIAVAPAAGTVTTQQVGRTLNQLPSDMQVVSQVPQGNFAPGRAKEIADAPVFDQLSNTLGSAIPSIQGKAADLAGKAVTGFGKRLTEDESRLSAVFVNAQGFADSITGPIANRLMNAVSTIRNSIGSINFDPLALLESAGITAIPDGLATIYSDAAGNRVIDIAKGAGTQSAKLMQTAELKTAALGIRDQITAPISDNQLAALSSFAAHVGTSKFNQSGIADLINSGDYAAVPQEMLKWSVGKRSQNGQPSVREDYIGRRRFEGELFATPDGVNLPVSSAQLSFDQLHQRLRSNKERFFNS